MKLTKMELRLQQEKRFQLNHYLPTLKLKKAMLQAELGVAIIKCSEQKAVFEKEKTRCEEMTHYFTQPVGSIAVDLSIVEKIQVTTENIGGIDLPVFQDVIFPKQQYPLFGTPIWLDGLVYRLRSLQREHSHLEILKERQNILERELRVIAIRVNLFEKNLIPKAEQNIQKIKVFLSDQALVGICQAKVAKEKILRKTGDE